MTKEFQKFVPAHHQAGTYGFIGRCGHCRDYNAWAQWEKPQRNRYGKWSWYSFCDACKNKITSKGRE